LPAKTEHFSIHASVVFQLGENLVTDATQALLELVKNSYDADATFCKISVDTSIATPCGTGQVLVEDDGIGMTEEAIKRGWLTISESAKKEFKRKGKVTGRERTPLGDKGLGRLGAQRLGSRLEICTNTGDGVERTVGIDWDDFVTSKLLEQVAVSYEVRESGRKTQGTILTISGLRDLELWKRSGKRDLAESLSQVISPYKQVKDFEVYPRIDGEEIDLFEIGTKLRNTAFLTYSLDFREGLFSVRGKAKLEYVRPEKGKKEKVLFEDLVTKDDGREFFAFLKKQKGESAYSLERTTGAWWVEFGRKLPLEDMDKVETVSGKIADPGPFAGEVDYYSLSPETSAKQKVFTDSSQYREMIQTLCGIRVYRDGFAVRVAPDWLQLGAQWTSATSYYGLKPQNTMGYISISARDNQCLEEKTDREGFSENANYRNFRELMLGFVKFAGDAQEFLRRGWNAFKSQKAAEAIDVKPDTTPEELSASLSSSLSRAPAYRLALTRATQKLAEATTQAVSLKGFQGTERLSQEDSDAFRKLVTVIDAASAEAHEVIGEVSGYLQELSKAEKLAEMLAEQVEQLKDQMRQMHEVIALGLTAESLSHEIKNITSGLADRNDQILKYLRSSGGRDSRIISYAEYVKSTVSSLKKELSYLAPSLQYVRESREEFDLYDLLSELMKHHLSRFSAERISLRINRTGVDEFRVRVNRGKMIQIFDNIFLNSEYWLMEDMRLNRIAFGTIEVNLKAPLVLISDNGRGVDEKLEETLFEPFVSGKGKGKGRGLGLFIVQQLLLSEGATVALQEERNKFDRRFVFELNLRGMCIG